MFIAHVGGEAFAGITAGLICGFILGKLLASKLVAAVSKIRR